MPSDKEVIETLHKTCESYEERLRFVQQQGEAVVGPMPEDDDRNGEEWAVDRLVQIARAAAALHAVCTDPNFTPGAAVGALEVLGAALGKE